MTSVVASYQDQAWVDLFAADAEVAVLRVLQQADGALSAIEVKRALQVGGADQADVERAWPWVQKKIKSHEHVVVESGHRYRWSAQAQGTSAAAALERLAAGNLPARRREALAAVVRASLPSSTAQREPTETAETAKPATTNPKTDHPVATHPKTDHLVATPPDSAAKQAAIPFVRALAELAIEVEELAINDASATAMIHRVRARVRRMGLEPIDHAGERSTLDRTRHEPIGGPINDGTPVVVVRPGYVWKAPSGDVLIARAVVQDRS